MKSFILGLCIVLWSSVAMAATPLLYFSDLIDGVNNGWGGDSTKGAAVTVWANNIDPIRGTDYITVGGVALTADADYAEWGATTYPTTARDLQRITFWLKSSMPTGATTITLTNADGTSVPIDFYVRDTGTIYFVARNGSDTNAGTLAAPFFSMPAARNVMVAGDATYVRAGLYTERVPTTLSYEAVLLLRNSSVPPNYLPVQAQGAINNTIALTVYPGEHVQVGNGEDNTDPNNATRFVMRAGGSASNHTVVAYWTISKFDIVMYRYGFFWQAAMYGEQEDISNRYIGMAITTTYTSAGTGQGFALFSSAQNFRFYGNYLYDMGKLQHDDDPAIYPGKSSNFYWQGGGQTTDVHMGWNELYNACGGGFKFNAHKREDRLEAIYIHDNLIHYNHTQIMIDGGGDPSGAPWYGHIATSKVWNNVFANAGQESRISTGPNGLGLALDGDGYTKHEYWNNTYYNNGRDIPLGVTLRTNAPNDFYFHHNIINNGPDSGLTDYWNNNFAGHIYDDTYNERGHDNLWYGLGNGPSWSTHSDYQDVDPQFNSDTPMRWTDYLLKSTSPIVIAGKQIGIQYDGVAPPVADPVCADFSGDPTGCGALGGCNYCGTTCQVDPCTVPTCADFSGDQSSCESFSGCYYCDPACQDSPCPTGPEPWRDWSKPYIINGVPSVFYVQP